MIIRSEYQELIESRERLLQAFSDPSIIRQSQHRLRDGSQSSFYFDFDILLNDPQRCIDVIRNYTAVLREINLRRQIEFLAFLEKMGRATVGAIRIGAAISIDTGIPSFIIRLGKEIPFERIKLPTPKGKPAWEKLTGMSIVMVTDHITSGHEIEKAVNDVEAVGGMVTDIVTYTLKPKDAYKTIPVFLDKGVVIHSIHNMYELPDRTYQITQGGMIESYDQFIKIES